MEAAARLEDILCVLCGSGDHRPLYQVEKGIKIVLCRNCGLAFMNPRYTPDYLREVYQGYQVRWIKRWKEREPESDPLAAFRKMLMQAARYEDLKLAYLSELCPERGVCDVGFGDGTFLLRAAEHGWQTLGVEIKQSSCEFLTENFQVPTIAGEFPEIDCGASGFGCVTMFDLIEHVTDPRAYLEKALKILLPGGIILVTVPNLASLEIRLQGPRAKNFQPAKHHLTFFTRKTLKRILTETGFERIEVLSPLVFKPWHPLARPPEALGFALGGETTLRLIARKPK